MSTLIHGVSAAGPQSRRRVGRRPAAAAVVLTFCASVCAIAPQMIVGRAARAAAPGASPATAPAGPATAPASGRAMTPEQKAAQLLDYLEGDYAKKAANPDWVTRAMGVVSLSRSPRPTATAKLLDILDKDKHDVVRLLAWQGLLARIGTLDAAATTRLQASTWTLAERDAFKGTLRLPLLRFMAAAGPSARSRQVWQKLFADTSAWEPQDIPVLDALGETLKAWHSGTLVAAMIDLMSSKDHCVRAEYVLQKAGCTAPTARSLLPAEALDPLSPNRKHPSSKDLWQAARSGADAWYSKDRANWKEPKTDPAAVADAFKALAPAFVPAPAALETIDADDKVWYADLELGRADLSQFEAVFVVDATGSMGDVLDWLRRDLVRTAAAFQLVCKEPVAIGITFYRDKGDPWVVQHLPLTTRLRELEPGLLKITADGGGDIPESVLDGLADAIQNNRWSKRSKASSKVVILVGDAPPHEPTIQACADLVKSAAASGTRTHVVKVTTEMGRNDLSAFDTIAAAGGGAAVAVEFRRPTIFRLVDDAGKPMPIKPSERPEFQTLVAQPVDDPPGDKILGRVLADTINPQYRDRVEPLARTILAYTELKSEPEKRMAFPMNTPPLVRKAMNAQGKK